MNMIGEFGWMDDWDLQAVVRGCSTSDYVNVSSYEAMDCLALPSFIAEPDDDILWNLSDLLETSRVVDDLEELYKPFYPQGTSIASSPVVEAANSPPNPEGTGNDCLEKAGVDGWPVPEPVKDSGIHQGANKYRRRKNLQKKEVQHVKADDVSSDVWAWRKYGQKPIKGSPYPRSYYRCSSSKGCSARKQVERSNSDPDIFIVTYTGDHCHSHPTRRNALAGSTRTKFSKQPNNNITSQCNNGAIVKVLKDHVGAACESEDSPSSSSSITLSPSTTPLLSADKTSHETTTRIDESIMGLGQHVSDDFSSIIFGDGLFMEYEEMNAMMGMDMPVTNDSFDGKEEFYKYGDY